MKLFGIIHTLEEYSPVVKHSLGSKKSYIFIGDSWREVGDILLKSVKDEETVYLQVEFPDISLFVSQHIDDGADSWFAWGPRVN